MIALSADNFDSLDAAAIAAEQACEQISFHSGYEFGGVILERGGRFYYTIAQTSKKTNHLDLRASFTSDYHFAAIYHTHPGTHETDRWFSTADVQAANAHRVVSYIGVQFEQGAVRRYTPNVTKITVTYSGEVIALGEVVE
jgi:hypothetical protein